MNVVKRVVVASVGHSFERVFRAVARVGVGEGDVVVFVNSIPRSSKAEEAMSRLREAIENIYHGVRVRLLWLDPRHGFEENVATIRRIVEEYAPCRAFILAVGGFRWLAIALVFTTLALNTVGKIRRVEEVSLELELEEDVMSKELVQALFPTQESRVIKIPLQAKLANITVDELRILETIAKGYHRAKQIGKQLGIPRATLQRKIVQLVKKNLLTYTPRGKTYIYNPTPLAKMLI